MNNRIYSNPNLTFINEGVPGTPYQAKSWVPTGKLRVSEVQRDPNGSSACKVKIWFSVMTRFYDLVEMCGTALSTQTGSMPSVLVAKSDSCSIFL